MDHEPASTIIDELADSGELDEYHLLHAARADMLRRLGSNAEAAENYELALSLASNDSERRFLERRLREVRTPASSNFRWAPNRSIQSNRTYSNQDFMRRLPWPRAACRSLPVKRLPCASRRSRRDQMDPSRVPDRSP